MKMPKLWILEHELMVLKSMYYGDAFAIMPSRYFKLTSVIERMTNRNHKQTTSNTLGQGEIK